ncbi:MAG TPA: ligase-associated DNA damage response endonuclease PdeM [Azospirillaceae bacterium]|nr:ligase-associated DNA damage response endonuclease PdeM [Azospirillaceae bacterium]
MFQSGPNLIPGPGMTSIDFTLNGARLTADLSGALWWAERRWLVVADLHLEKGSAFATRGQFLPPYDTAATLSRLEEACARLDPARVICLGDSFHDRRAAERVSAADGRRIQDLTAARDWVWIAGNHDPAPPKEWGGSVVEEITEGPLVLRHEALPGPVAGEVSGHYHPKAAVGTRAGRISARCFATDGMRLILPAFGAFTGGLNVLSPAIGALLGRRFTAILLGRDKLHAFPAERLAP